LSRRTDWTGVDKKARFQAGTTPLQKGHSIITLNNDILTGKSLLTLYKVNEKGEKD